MRYAILAMERTEELKALRRKNGDKGMKFSKGKAMRPRDDGKSNTITGVQKDNLLLCHTESGGSGQERLFDKGDSVHDSVQRDERPTAACGMEGAEMTSPPPRAKIIGFVRDSDKGAIISRPIKDVANTITQFTATSHTTAQYVLTPNNNMEEEKDYVYRIRKLTPRECFRLMDIDEEYIDKMLKSGVSKTRLYSAAGNGVVVGNYSIILENLLFPKKPTKPVQLTLDLFG